MEAPIQSQEAADSGLLVRNRDILVCPVCGGSLELARDCIRCFSCGQEFCSEDGIPQMFWQNDWPAGKPDVTEIIKSFYEKTPFPNYDEVDSSTSLREKATRGVFARLLDEQIPFNARILEAGCGTGQLSNFLGMSLGPDRFCDRCLHELAQVGGGAFAR